MLFCLHAKITYLPIRPTDLSRYIAFLARSLKAWISVLNYLNGVRIYHAAHGYQFPQMRNFSVLLTLRGLRKRLSATPSQKLPITVDILLNIYKKMDYNNITHNVLWCLFLIAFFGFLRKSNLVPPTRFSFDLTKHISRGSFHLQPDGTLYLNITWSKTIQCRERSLIIPFSPIPHSPLCPVAAYKRMVQLIPAPLSSPAFLVPLASSLTTLTYTSFTSHLHYLLAKVGLKPSNFSGHSFRRGGCTFAASCNIPSHLLKIHGDWRSSAYERYISLPVTQRRQVSHTMSKHLQG